MDCSVSRMLSGCVVMLFVGCEVWAGAPGEGVKAGEFIFNPYADLKAQYDSNVRVAAEDEVDDFSYSGRFGLDMANTAEAVKLNAGLWGFLERFTDLTAEDHEDYGESFKVGFLNRDILHVVLSESYGHVRELDYGVGSIQTREDIQAEATVGKDWSDKLDSDLGYKFRATEYESPALYDWYEHSARTEASHRMTDKTAGLLAVLGGHQVSDANAEDGNFVSVLLGAKTRGSDKVQGRAALGWIGHYSANDMSIPAFDVGGLWQATEKLRMSVSANNAVEPPSQDLDNYNVITRAEIGFLWQVLNELSLGVTTRYSRNHYDQDVDVDGVMRTKKDNTYTGILNVNYIPPAKFLEAFLEGKVETKDSALDGNDYDQVQVSLGLKARY